MRPGCKHDPITRKEKLHEANRPPLAPLTEWGRSFEADRIGLPLAESDRTANNVNNTSQASSSLLNNALPSNTINRDIAQDTFAKVCGGLVGVVSAPSPILCP
jgi:hypothetical protein